MKEIIKTKNEPYNRNNLWLNDGLHEYKDGKWTTIGEVNIITMQKHHLI